jgi:hypothetical protein
VLGFMGLMGGGGCWLWVVCFFWIGFCLYFRVRVKEVPSSLDSIM